MTIIGLMIRSLLPLPFLLLPRPIAYLVTHDFFLREFFFAIQSVNKVKVESITDIYTLTSLTSFDKSLFAPDEFIFFFYVRQEQLRLEWLRLRPRRVSTVEFFFIDFGINAEMRVPALCREMWISKC